jgi:cell wall-associated NlpC family hydrolase
MNDQRYPTARRGPRVRARLARGLYVLVTLAVVSICAAAPAFAGTRPTVSGLSQHRGAYWGGTRVTVFGSGFNDVREVLFGKAAGSWVEVLSASKLTVVEPRHAYATVDVRVVTGGGESARNSADRFTFTRPTLDSPIQGGLTARQEQRISARVRDQHHGVAIAPRAGHWTAAMGITAMRRARSWVGLPYSWAGGTFTGPTRGVCASGGGETDCHVIGFDCSGLTLNAWGPYEHLVHYAATQHAEAGRFHPTLGQLVPGDLLFFAEWPGGPIGHVVIYAGRGMVFQAPQSGYLVEKSRLSDLLAWGGPYRGATRPMSTGQQGSGPAVATMTSQLPLGGGYVRISGRHLATATSVSVGSTRLYTFARRSTGTLVVKVPPHRAGTVHVTVSNPWGSVTRSVTFVAPPHLGALSPANGPTDGGTVVTLTGRSLAAVTRVTVDSTAVPFTVVSGRTITITVPAHVAATVPVVARSPFGTSNRLSYTFVAAPPPTPTPSPTSSAPPG